jgi:hypothetical protein
MPLTDRENIVVGLDSRISDWCGGYLRTEVYCIPRLFSTFADL